MSKQTEVDQAANTEASRQKKRRDNYSLGIAMTAIIGVSISLAMLLSFGLGSVDLPEWLIVLLYGTNIALTTSQMVSGVGYITSGIDSLTRDNQSFALSDFDDEDIEILRRILDSEESNALQSAFIEKISSDAYKSQLFTKEEIQRIQRLLLSNKQEKLSKKLVDVSALGTTFLDWPTAIKRNFSFRKNLKTALTDGQFVGICLGIVGAIALTIIMAVSHISPVHSFNFVISGILSFIGNVSSFAGLGNRLGAVLNYAFKKKENINYTIGITCGVIAGIILSTLVISLIGATSIMTLGGALPAWAGAFLFIVGCIGTCASAGSYIGRMCDLVFGNDRWAGDVIRGKKSKDNAFTKENSPQEKRSVWKSFTHHITRTNRGKYGMPGIIFGIILGSVLIGTGLLTLPFFGLGLSKLLAGFLLMATCISAMGGLSYRLGQMTDTFKGKMDGANEATVPHQSAGNTSPISSKSSDTVNLLDNPSPTNESDSPMTPSAGPSSSSDTNYYRRVLEPPRPSSSTLSSPREESQPASPGNNTSTQECTSSPHRAALANYKL